MKVGDLVTTKLNKTHRVGLVEEIWTAGSPRWMVRVLWGSGETGNYFARQLEVL